MTYPEYVCRIAFVSAPYAASPTWVDVSDDLMSFNRRRGRQHELNRMEAGTATVVLRNTSGDYWPNNSGSPYYGNIQPRKRINIRAVWDGTTYDLYTGYIEKWQPGFRAKAGFGAIMTLTCSDLIKPLSKLLLNSAGYSSELTGDRIDNVLDTLGYPAAHRVIDAGQTTLQATGALANVNAMNHLFAVTDTELGMLFVRGDGYVIFQDRHARLKTPYTVSQAIFGNDRAAGELPIYEITPSLDDSLIYNDIRITRLSGTEQTASDATSIASYGKQGLQKPSMLMTTDSEAQSQAQYLLGRYKDAYMRLEGLVAKAGLDPDDLYPAVLGFDISTRITVRLDQAGINRDYYIEGIDQRWSKDSPGDLDTKWQVTDASLDAFWVLEIAGYSELSITTRLSY